MTKYVEAKIETMEQPITAGVFLSIVFLLVCAYAYFVNGAITFIVAAKDMQTEIAESTSLVGNLEGEFLAAKSNMNLEYVNSHGFSESAVNTLYITKKPSVSLSFNR